MLEIKFCTNLFKVYSYLEYLFILQAFIFI